MWRNLLQLKMQTSDFYTGTKPAAMLHIHRQSATVMRYDTITKYSLCRGKIVRVSPGSTRVCRVSICRQTSRSTFLSCQPTAISLTSNPRVSTADAADRRWALPMRSPVKCKGGSGGRNDSLRSRIARVLILHIWSRTGSVSLPDAFQRSRPTSGNFLTFVTRWRHTFSLLHRFYSHNQRYKHSIYDPTQTKQ